MSIPTTGPRGTTVAHPRSSGTWGQTGPADPGPDHRGPVVTPVVGLRRLFAPWPTTVWAKCEQWQPSGSAKERSATLMLEGAQRQGRIAPGGTVVESTSGNLGVALARQCLLRGLRLVTVLDDRTNTATVRLLRALGAEIDVVSVPAGEDRLAARMARVAEIVAQRPGAVTLDQYTNPDNPGAHTRGALSELVAQTGRAPTHLYVATSTAGTLLGCQQAVEENRWDTELVAVDATGSVLFGGSPGPRHLPGLGAGVESDHARRAHPDRVHRVAEEEMVLGCRLLSRREGLLAGASTGAIVAAVARDLPQLPAGATVAVVVHDGGVPYLDTVYDDDWVRATLPDPRRALADPATLVPCRGGDHG